MRAAKLTGSVGAHSGQERSERARHHQREYKPDAYPFHAMVAATADRVRP
jgi:hypothetical protein